MTTFMCTPEPEGRRPPIYFRVQLSKIRRTRIRTMILAAGGSRLMQRQQLGTRRPASFTSLSRLRETGSSRRLGELGSTRSRGSRKWLLTTVSGLERTTTGALQSSGSSVRSSKDELLKPSGHTLRSDTTRTRRRSCFHESHLSRRMWFSVRQSRRNSCGECFNLPQLQTPKTLFSIFLLGLEPPRMR